MIGGAWKTVHPGITAAGHQFKSTSPVTIPNTFVAQMSNGHTGIFERTGGATDSDGDEIRELMGSSVPQMLGNEEVEQRLGEESMEKFEERLDHEIIRLLNGW